MTTPVFETLELRWCGLWDRLDRLWGVQGNSQVVYQELILAYSAPGRHYHNLQHLAQGGRVLTELFEAHQVPAERKALVEWAWWFHDFVYDRQPDDEARSAEAAKQRASACKLPLEVCQTVHDLILATAHLDSSQRSLPPGATFLMDADLSILGVTPEVFDAFEEQIRLEYHEYPDPVFAAGRSRILQSFIDRSHIYHSAYMQERYELQARFNLTKAVAKWRQAMSSVTPLIL